MKRAMCAEEVAIHRLYVITHKEKNVVAGDSTPRLRAIDGPLLTMLRH
jgi:hypothetical protein